MIDVEMAEEYVDILLDKDDSELDKFLDENLGDLELNKKQAVTLLGIIKGVGICSYLAGLKAGRPEWHKVADGDLPPTSGEMHAERYPILACTKNGYVTVAIRRKHGRAYEWFCFDYDGNTLYLDKEVIAWCEIPKYTEA